MILTPWLEFSSLFGLSYGRFSILEEKFNVNTSIVSIRPIVIAPPYDKWCISYNHKHFVSSNNGYGSRKKRYAHIDDAKLEADASLKDHTLCDMKTYQKYQILR